MALSEELLNIIELSSGDYLGVGSVVSIIDQTQEAYIVKISSDFEMTWKSIIA